MVPISDISSIFEFHPFPSIVVEARAPYTVRQANRACLEATGLTESELTGHNLFDIFPGSAAPANGNGSAGCEWSRSLSRVCASGKPDRMAAKKRYTPFANVREEAGAGKRDGNGEGEARYWTQVNAPVFGESGELEYIICTATELPPATEGPKREQTVAPAGDTVIHGEEAGAMHKLRERIKEQSCLYRISNLNEQELCIDDLLSEAAVILPRGWQHNEVTAAEIHYQGNSYESPGYRQTRWIMTAETDLRDGTALEARVVYLEERPEQDEGPFLREERKLIDSVINHLALKIDRILSQQKLKEKQQLLDKAYQLARIGTWEFDMQTHDLYWSPVTKEVHGFDESYEPDLESTIELFKEGINREIFERAARDAIDHEKPFDVELKIVSGQGDERWIRATGEPEYRDGVCTRFYGISQNVTERRQAQEELKLREQRFKSLVQDGSDLIAILDADANYLYVSPTSESILGIPAEDFIGTNALDYIHEEDRQDIAELLADLPSDQRIQIPPFRFIDSEGNWRWIETTLTNMMEDPVVGGMVSNSRDVTRQIRQQRQNREALKEKETLLAEIHHRVKNNLAVISGMMQLQASGEENSEVIDRLSDGINRIKTMANIHEQLYRSHSFSRLEFADNIRSLVLNILKTFRSQTRVDIDFRCKPIQLNINQAIPCSLIVNEVVTNIFKHAFPERSEGAIEIDLSEECSGEQVVLLIRDNGIGLPEDIDAGGGSLGLNLIDVLSQQLGGDYRYEPIGEGTLFSIRFQKEELKGIGNSLME